MTKQYTTDAEGDVGVDHGGEISASSMVSLNASHSPGPGGDRRGGSREGSKQRLNSACSAISLSNSTQGRTSGSGGGGGAGEASPSPSTSSNTARNQQRLAGAAHGASKIPVASAAQEAPEASERERKEMDRETRLEM